MRFSRHFIFQLLLLVSSLWVWSGARAESDFQQRLQRIRAQAMVEAAVQLLTSLPAADVANMVQNGVPHTVNTVLSSSQVAHRVLSLQPYALQLVKALAAVPLDRVVLATINELEALAPDRADVRRVWEGFVAEAQAVAEIPEAQERQRKFIEVSERLGKALIQNKELEKVAASFVLDHHSGSKELVEKILGEVSDVRPELRQEIVRAAQELATQMQAVVRSQLQDTSRLSQMALDLLKYLSVSKVMFSLKVGRFFLSHGEALRRVDPRILAREFGRVYQENAEFRAFVQTVIRSIEFQQLSRDVLQALEADAQARQILKGAKETQNSFAFRRLLVRLRNSVRVLAPRFAARRCEQSLPSWR